MKLIINGAVVGVYEWISNFIPNIIGYVINYPCWDWSKSMLVKGATGPCITTGVMSQPFRPNASYCSSSKRNRADAMASINFVMFFTQSNAIFCEQWSIFCRVITNYFGPYSRVVEVDVLFARMIVRVQVQIQGTALAMPMWAYHDFVCNGTMHNAIEF